MKKLILLAMVLVILLSPLAYATKSVTYITSDATASRCSDLTGNDKWFCERLENSVGYTVTLVHENQVRDGTSIWTSAAGSSDMIFLGDISQNMIDTSKTDRAKFCGNLSSYTGSGKAKLFATFLGVFNDTATGYNLTGCALSILGVNSVYYNNICSNTGYSGFKRNKTGYPTDNLSSSPTLLSPQKNVYVHGAAGQGVGWVNVVCNTPPTGASSGEYSVVNNTSTGVFWGLSDTTAFTDSTKNMFDRMVWYILDDTTWSVDTMIIPSSVTANQSVMVLAKVKERGQTVSSATVNFTIGGYSGSMSYNPSTGYWEKRDAAVPSTGTPRLNVTAYSGSTLMGYNDNLDFDSGSLVTTINSGDFAKNSNYRINVTSSGDDSVSMTYRIWNKTNYTVISSGSIDQCSGTTCTRLIDTGNWDGVILEVQAINSTVATSGGAYKVLSAAGASNFTIITDKSVYLPGDTVNVDIYTVGVTSSANMSVIDSKGIVLLSNSTMTKNATNETHWYKSYTLGETADNGTYAVKVLVDGGSPTIKTRSIDVLAWRISATLDRSVYSAGNNVTINVSTSEVHAPTNFTVKINVTDPDDEVTRITTNATIVNNNTYSTVYHLPENATGGEYEIKIFTNDTFGRVYNTTKKFTIGNTSMLSVSPSSWSVSTDKGGYFNQTFKIKNIGEETLYNFTIYTAGDLSDYIDTTEKDIEQLDTDESVSVLAYLTLNQPGNRTGSIIIENNVTKYVINVTGSLSSPPVQESRLFVAPTTLSVVTIANKVSHHNFTLTTTSPDGASSIAASVTGDVLGMVSAKSTPSSITTASPGTMEVEVTTSAKEPGSYTGTMNISSTAGSVLISPITIEVIGDLNTLSREKLADLSNFTANITALKSRGKNVTEIESLMNLTRNLLNETMTAYNEGDYALSKSKYDLAMANIQSIGAKINELASQVEPPADYSGIIWAVAIIIVVAIVGIMGYKNKGKLQQMLQNLQQKGKKAEPQREEKRAEYKKPSYGEGEYRTEFY